MLNALEKLARRWAAYVSRDSASIVWSLILAINGLVWAAIGFLMIESIIVGLMGLMVMNGAFFLFERNGFVQLLKDAPGKDSGAGKGATS